MATTTLSLWNPFRNAPQLISYFHKPPVRLLIADDVGVGKTIEAGLIARELWERGEVLRIAVLCPPYLCDQWQKELAEKFHLKAVVISPGTIARLERHEPTRGYLSLLFGSLEIPSADKLHRSNNAWRVVLVLLAYTGY